MKLYCLRRPDHTERDRYIIDLILHRLGYFFEWVDDPAEAPQRCPLLIYDQKPLQLVPGRPGVIPLIRCIDYEQAAARPQWVVTEYEGHSFPLLANGARPDPSKALPAQVLHVDVPANIFYHLCRLEEQGFSQPEDADRHARDSILFRHGKLLLPIADLLMQCLDEAIRKICRKNNFLLARKTHYPAAESYGLALTHDVDFIRAFHPLKKSVLKMLVRWGLNKGMTPEQLEQLDRSYWTFDRLFDFYEQKNLPATFFFLTRLSEGRHYRYSIKSKQMLALLMELDRRGHEAGLHPSRFAFEHPSRYKRELKRLKRVSPAAVRGMRHHYLRCLFPHIWTTAGARGLAYDSSMIYNQHGGFRAGTCHPYETFDFIKNQATGVVEFPTAFFEKSLPDNGRNNVSAREFVTGMLTTVRDQHGLLTALWHTNNLFRTDSYPGLWEALVELMAGENVYIRTLADHEKWFRQRQQIGLAYWHRSAEAAELSLQLPSGLPVFSLEFDHPLEAARAKSQDVRIAQIGNRLTLRAASLPEELELSLRFAP